jgi:hypothetical protein
MMAFRTLALAGAALAMTAGIAIAQRKVTREPAMGQMRYGQKLLVDDGTCPAGQIKLVTGGNHVKVGGTGRILRHRTCVSRRR